MRNRVHLFLSLGRKGFGETILGMRLAQSLRDLSDEIFFLAHTSSSRLLQGNFSHFAFNSEALPLVDIFINDHMARLKPDSIVLADYFTTALTLDQYGRYPTFLHSGDVPVFAIDTWHSARTAGMIDLFTNDFHEVNLWGDALQQLCPVPFLSVDDVESNIYQSLPDKVKVPAKIRRHIRHALGLSSGDRAVLFCSAEWQHSHYKSEAGRRLAEALPRLVAGYLAQLGPAVHLVHVGPKTLELDALLGERYHWLPSVSPDAFDNIIASSDLFLTPNISATTITKALVSGVPVVALQNSLVGDTLEAICAQLPFCVSPFLADWIRSALPLYPFSMWPLGYHAFLAPLLANNPYAEAFDILELLHQPTIHHTLQNLLFSPAAKEEQLHKHALYLAQVRALPTGAQRIHQLIGV